MRNEWVPASAALLVTGAMALALASILTPDGSNAAETLRLVREQDSRWLAVSAIYFLAAAMLILGLPSLLVLLDRPPGRYVGLAGVVSLAIGFVGVAGYAALLVFFRALVKTEAIRDQALDALGEDVGLRIFLYGWIVAFLLGELLLAAALLRAHSTPRWVPMLMLGHVLAVPLAALLPDAVARTTALAFALAFAGVGVRAADAHLGSVRRLVV